ncbi:hypothetical protein SK066_08775 [Paenibacillus hunanensis]|uniref:hypothetical protein n=1 Tax=Paenibacillus hunanensis TaxID=539262 RepID=UPI002A6B0075|nr:hypothetical protein [Paenibacillus hunanensis]WPP43011.1 hypothetical protein SK066_08775 [Paenibacillus hunanensis]
MIFITFCSGYRWELIVVQLVGIADIVLMGWLEMRLMLLKGMSFCHTGGWEFGYSWWGFGIVQMWWLEFELNLLGMEWCDG